MPENLKRYLNSNIAWKCTVLGTVIVGAVLNSLVGFNDAWAGTVIGSLAGFAVGCLLERLGGGAAGKNSNDRGNYGEVRARAIKEARNWRELLRGAYQSGFSIRVNKGATESLDRILSVLEKSKYDEKERQ